MTTWAEPSTRIKNSSPISCCRTKIFPGANSRNSIERATWASSASSSEEKTSVSPSKAKSLSILIWLSLKRVFSVLPMEEMLSEKKEGFPHHIVLQMTDDLSLCG